MNFDNYDDEQLNELRVEVITEQEERQHLKQIPQQIADLQARYADCGGDVDDLPDGSK